MALLPYSAPDGAVYTLIAPDLNVAVFNDPTSAYYVGGLGGDQGGVTGLDSAEVREAFFNHVEAAGAVPGNHFHGRRPFTFQGLIVPSSAVDRSNKITLLKRATNAMLADGTVSWDVPGGENVYVRFRRQLPERISGPWSKSFFAGLVANDPFVYSTALKSSYHNVAGQQLHAVPGGGAGTTIATVPVTFPAAGTYTIKVWVYQNTSWNGGNVSISPANLTGSSTAVSTPSNGATLGSWQLVTINVTVVAGDLSGDINLVAASAPTAGSIEAVLPQFSSSAGLPVISATWTQPANWTHTYPSGSSFGPDPQGTAPSQPIIRMYGPGTNPTLTYTPSGAAAQTIAFTAGGGVTLTGGQYIDVDIARHTVVNQAGTNLYSKAVFPSTWFELNPVATQSPTSGPVNVTWASGSTSASILRIQWRNTYI